MSISLEELVLYWLGELPSEREAAVEERLFEDDETARRLDTIARIGHGVREVIRAGRLQAGLTVLAVESLSAAGLRIRSYRVTPGQTVPCTIAREDLVAIRLAGGFSEVTGAVSVLMDGTFEGMPPASERYDDVPVDRATGEIVLVYPGDRIRALPRSRFTYRVSEAGRSLGEFGLDHTPAS